MHDCRQTKEKLIDLVFDELHPGERARLMAQMRDCADCLDQYRSMSETLSVFDQSKKSAQPAESYWHEYHRALRYRMATMETVEKQRAPFWKRMFASSIPVPVPLAAAVAIVMLATMLFAIRRPASSMTNAQPASQPASEKVRVVEVPVIQERVVTRTVYVDRPSRSETRSQQQSQSGNRTINDAVAQSSGAETKKSPGVSLEGFQPADEVKLRIIKGSYPDEK